KPASSRAARLKGGVLISPSSQTRGLTEIAITPAYVRTDILSSGPTILSATKDLIRQNTIARRSIRTNGYQQARNVLASRIAPAAMMLMSHSRDTLIFPVA